MSGFSVVLQRQVFEGFRDSENSKFGWLEKKIILPFVPFVGLKLGFAFHVNSILPSSNEFVTFSSVCWTSRESVFYIQCEPDYIELREKIERYLTFKTECAWDSMMVGESPD